MKKLVLIIFLFATTTSIGQSASEPDAKQLELAYTEICKTNKIYVFGYDFTRFKLIDVSRAGKDEKMKVVISEIIQKMNKRNLEKQFADWFNKDSVVFAQESVNKMNETIIPSKTIGTEFEYNPNKIPFDSLSPMIKRYQTGEMQGMGFVQIVECFFKENKEVTVWYVFFDIKSKRIIDSIKIKSDNAGGIANLSEYWTRGLQSNLEFYAKDYYLDVRKVCRKIK
jgi:hypothetical protein